MNKEQFLIERILELDPIQEIYRAFYLAKILFSLKTEKSAEGQEYFVYASQLDTLKDLESAVYKTIPLKICYELFYTYRTCSLNFLINHQTPQKTIIKIPMYELRDSMRKLYFSIVELIFRSDIVEMDFGVADSGDTSYKGKGGSNEEL